MSDQPDPWRLDKAAEAAARRLAETLARRLALGRARCFRAVFTLGGATPRDREVVLAELRDFCAADETVFRADAMQMARMAGRREVFLRLSKYLSLTDDQVRRLVPMEVDDGL